jgi:hypothetical protein
LPDSKSEEFFPERLDRLLVICPSGRFAAAQMPGFDLPWRPNQSGGLRFR